jgi:hypothetical protein
MPPRSPACRPAPDAAAAACTPRYRRFAIKKDTEPYCALVKDLWTKGHEIALHTHDHVRLDPPIDEEKKSEPTCQPASQLVNLSVGQSVGAAAQAGSRAAVQAGRKLGGQRSQLAWMLSAAPAGQGSSRLAPPQRLRLPSPVPPPCPAHVCFQLSFSPCTRVSVCRPDPECAHLDERHLRHPS